MNIVLVFLLLLLFLYLLGTLCSVRSSGNIFLRSCQLRNCQLRNSQLRNCQLRHSYSKCSSCQRDRRMRVNESAAPVYFKVYCENRWQVYHRLQELGMNCQYGGLSSLMVDVKTATDVIQLWSIVHRISKSRQELISRLTRSWKLPDHHLNN
ncbi:MAG: hypothetical protein HLUCCA11_16720 [Phormidesmis priestleyi Ana]|uniref:Uncharacterized protein n=1 Tax=Phormidesmis priestleyi Ana TaxID=1666911 RepID=A0A0P7YTI7_9CYAN|nr:MAG: hypothetical protein HLUCCA11_16720 [Phormidesmis priestleyi Ana]